MTEFCLAQNKKTNQIKIVPVSMLIADDVDSRPPSYNCVKYIEISPNPKTYNIEKLTDRKYPTNDYHKALQVRIEYEIKNNYKPNSNNFSENLFLIDLFDIIKPIVTEEFKLTFKQPVTQELFNQVLTTPNIDLIAKFLNLLGINYRSTIRKKYGSLV